MSVVVDQRGDRTGEQLAEKPPAIGGCSQPATETRMLLDGGHESPFRIGREGAGGEQPRAAMRSGLPALSQS